MYGKTRKVLSILIITVLLLTNGSWALASGYPQGQSALEEEDLSSARSFAVPQWDKTQLSGARKKLSTDLLSLVDESNMPSGQTGPGLRQQMEGIGQFRQAPFTRGISEAGDGHTGNNL
ncbi:MAG: hypothetical protein VR69_14885 [Peptococcaceae bacterium BRH_c4b]|nr:MAG: hypothetical protein VR69_14885 [Peptococcaceae bacterium BRH_c4b]